MTARGGADITVVVAVFNTMPYLTRCLTSLVGQTIGLDRMEIIAVDDGSTDGSGDELDRFARRYPKTVQVIHQANSGGPAGPSNRALERATGRYVFFLGADDYLGREALARLVAAADEHGSDVVLGRLVGVNGRYVHPGIFAESAVDVDLFDSTLPWSMSNTKLFRRELIERHGLRFPETMPMLSDQPFTIEACLRAGRISVLADYDYYFAVRRLDASNITFRPRHEELLRCTAYLMDFVAERVEPGKQRDAFALRHFSWEVAKLLRPDFLLLDRAAQQRLQAGVRELADRYLTDDISQQLIVYKRLLMKLAQHHSLDDLIALIRYEDERGDPPVVEDGGRLYASYPGFRDPARRLPDSWFDITDKAADWLARLDVVKVVWGSAPGSGRVLTVTARSPVPDLVERCGGEVRLTAGDVIGRTVETVRAADGVTLRVQFPLADLLAPQAARRQGRTVRAEVTTGDTTGAAALRVRKLAGPGRSVARVGSRLYVVTPTSSNKGRLVITITPVTLRQVIGRLRRGLPLGGRAK